VIPQKRTNNDKENGANHGGLKNAGCRTLRC
jgi:hypothetical protein